MTVWIIERESVSVCSMCVCVLCVSVRGGAREIRKRNTIGRFFSRVRTRFRSSHRRSLLVFRLQRKRLWDRNSVINPFPSLGTEARVR